MTTLAYVSIVVIMIAIFVIVLKTARQIDDKKVIKSAVKTQAVAIINTQSLGAEKVGIDTKALLDKVKSLEMDTSTERTFKQKVIYQINYTYDAPALRQYYIMLAKCIVGVFLFTYFIGEAPMFISIFVSVIGGPVVSLYVLKSKFDKKIAHFLDNFVYAMDLIGRGVQSGLSINDCFKQILDDSEPVVAEQFLGIINDTKLGLSITQTMERFMKRMDLKEVHFFCLSIMIQQKTGGNLAEVIMGLSKILRDRKSLLLKIKTLSSEAKSSAMIMGSLPIAIVLLLSLIAPDYMGVLTGTPNGKMVMLGCGVWMGCGALVMRSMINFYK